ncbi:bifunctional riboflavin kinase/FAD synthetase [Pelagibacterium xiamenense]|uniref:bifunctional riboflavin kinase/FAD synthetase n=1 Tax=Pelagibacterium xiamenense TaxID=2901140 RepID=UPI001E531754|nr:bifunctional riboflavin kinase/FAD synthetase [Pelagibacterium xiamenense]MCD7059212.1 bifunctional riboflavin kinase/FAD synthetase [Pelagibacterium xiamenense]
MTTTSEFFRLDGLDAVPDAARGGVVAIGNFDGFHRGHQSVFDAAKAMAREKHVPALILTFEPHPRDVFAPAPFLHRLTYAGDKARLAEALGFDGLVVLPFSRDLSSVEAPDFVSRYLIDALGASGVVAGADFHFGKGRAGTPEFLKAEGERRGFGVEIVGMLDEGDEPVSSSRIRAALAEGGVEAANRLLGYHHFISGTVIEGDKRGRELGYPTANFALPETNVLAQGVYGVKVRVAGEVFGGVAAFGKPMFDNTRPPFEAFIFDFDRDIYGQTIEVALLSYIRGQMTFDSLDALIAQMDADTAAARITIAQARPLSRLDAALGFIAD